jgi:pyruvate formate lyase activating enzyme
VELTSLIVPGKNDSLEDMEREAAWIAGIDPDIPLHITRYFPRHRMAEPPTRISLMRELKSVAERHLSRVLLGNV